jgi:hypothetical protein
LRPAAALVGNDVALKPNQINVNPVELARKTVEHHKPAGALSSLAKESYNMTI